MKANLNQGRTIRVVVGVCPHCGKARKSEEEVGKKARCTVCKKCFVIAEAKPEAKAPEETRKHAPCKACGCEIYNPDYAYSKCPQCRAKASKLGAEHASRTFGRSSHWERQRASIYAACNGNKWALENARAVGNL